MQCLIPRSVQAVESFGICASASLFPSEAAIIERSVEKRRREFAAVRSCAREALASLNLPVVPLLPGFGRAPQWPAGAVGSMTHCDGYCAAVVGRSSEVLAIGIDAEPNLPLPADVMQLVAGIEERRHLQALPLKDVAWDRLLFCAKEAVFKAWFPLTHSWLNFDDVIILVDVDGLFRVEMFSANGCHPRFPWTSFEGRWNARRGIIATAVVLR